ncbi:MAG TPA: hypothetical protein VFD90_12900 [Gaiellales bacterium]|jgi:hypothetical protein|nr:hypothetical protein [Gaiellales bacterium]
MRRAAVLAALLVLVAAPAVARAAVSPEQAVAIVKRQPAARTLLLTHPGATFGAQPAGGDWLVIARQALPRTPLASWLVDRRSGAVTGHSPTSAIKRLEDTAVIRIAMHDPKVADWVRRYPAHTAYATYDPTFHTWTVHVNAGRRYGEIAQIDVDDRTGKVLHAWTGPQVSWTMARGYKGWFGRKLNDTRLWLAFCAVFLLALVDWRRIWTLRTLDLVALLSFSVSLWYFERGLVFWAVPLQYPPMVYLIARLTWIGLRARPREASTGRLPAWALAALAVFLIGFRLGLNAFDATVIDVGYAGTVGADRILRGQLPYGNFPDASGVACGVRNSDGTSSAYRQAKEDGRCESPVANGDTYGPVNYAAYVPAVAVTGWTGRWDDLPSSHGTSSIFDLACAAGMAAVGWRFGRMRMAALCALAWLAYPFTGYALQANTNDMIVAAFAIWGFAFALSPIRRGTLLALASWTKFAPFLLWPLWSRYPRGEGEPARRSFLRGAAGLALGTALAGVLVLLGGGGLHGFRLFWDRTAGFQLGRSSPFSIWDWNVYLPGFPDLSGLQTALEALLVTCAVLLAFRPRRLDAVRLAALSGALVLGFELVLTHWSYLYLPWAFPFAVLALVLPSGKA